MTPTPAPGLAFVRRITTAETYGGSTIVIPEQARDKLAEMQWEVVAVGAPEPCDDEDCEREHYQPMNTFSGLFFGAREHACDLHAGDWVLVRKRAAMPSPEPDLYIIRQADVIGRFDTTEAA